MPSLWCVGLVAAAAAVVVARPALAQDPEPTREAVANYYSSNLGPLEVDESAEIVGDVAELAAPQPSMTAMMRPSFDFAGDWEIEMDDLSVSAYDVIGRMPTFPVYGSPPLVSAGFSWTNFDAPASFDLPSEVYELSVGVSWMRPISQRWAMRLAFDVTYATDFDNTSSDAWRFGGGVFGIYSPNERWTWTLGALATGWEDIPVLPIAGVIWKPSSDVRFDLLLPRPRISYLIADCPRRKSWIYVGGAIGGGTWAYERASGADELLTYRSWRAVVGWESGPPQVLPGMPGPGGPTFEVEAGYVFGRKFEFDSGLPDIEPGETLVLRAGLRF